MAALLHRAAIYRFGCLVRWVVWKRIVFLHCWGPHGSGLYGKWQHCEVSDGEVSVYPSVCLSVGCIRSKTEKQIRMHFGTDATLGVFHVIHLSCHMTLVMKKFTTRLWWKPKPNRKPRFFSAKPAETDWQETFWNRNNTIKLAICQLIHEPLADEMLMLHPLCWPSDASTAIIILKY